MTCARYVNIGWVERAKDLDKIVKFIEKENKVKNVIITNLIKLRR